jgi:hypothetical protein
MEENGAEYIGSKDQHKGKPMNKSLMVGFLSENDPRLEDRMEAADEMISYCQSKMMELLSGNITSYWKSILEVVNKPEISSTSYGDWGVLASVPSAYLRAVERENAQERRAAARLTSSHFGKIGDQYEAKVHIISKIFSIKYNKTWYTGVDEHGKLLRDKKIHEAIGSDWPMDHKILYVQGDTEYRKTAAAAYMTQKVLPQVAKESRDMRMSVLGKLKEDFVPFSGPIGAARVGYIDVATTPSSLPAVYWLTDST